jgi:SRSO17 transposase
MREADVPEDIEFKTKPEIALALLDEANGIGIPHQAVVTDSSYGGNDTYLSGLEARNEKYVASVPSDLSVILEDDTQAKSKRADALMHHLPKRKWKTIRWREGTKGWLPKKFVAIRAYRVVDVSLRVDDP